MTLSGYTYTCRAGETFDSVALAEYGDEVYAADLLNANPALSGVPIFAGGEVLKLPVVEVPDEDGDEDEDEDYDEDDYMPATAPWKE